jgi:hypothetical protein
MNVLTNYILKVQGAFMDYATQSSLKLEEEIVLFIIQPTMDNLETLIYAKHVVQNTVELCAIFFPKETPEIIEKLIKEELLDTFQIYNFNIDIEPLDADLYCLESDESFREIYIDKNYDSISKLAEVVLKFEAAFGKIQSKYIKGDMAKIFNDYLTLKEAEHKLKTNEQILGMIVLDRSIDFITPLLSNYTYEGMIDEYLGINKGNITVKRSFTKSILKPDYRKKKPDDNIEYPLTSDVNGFFSDLRCMHYITATNYISSINDKYVAKFDKNKEVRTTDQMVETFSSFKDFKSIESYLNDNTNFLKLLYNEVKNIDDANIRQHKLALINGDNKKVETYYNDYISEKKDLYKILNVIILQSLIQNGIENYFLLKREIMNIYGYQQIFLFRNLEFLNLVKEKENITLQKLFKSRFQQINENLNLINRNFKLRETNDLSYIVEGYCPLTLKLIEKAGEGGWSEIRETLNLIPGKTSIPFNEKEVANPTENINTIFVVFLGGITYAEIEGIRYLNRKYKEIYDKSNDENKTRKQFIIITTQILNSKKLYDILGKNFKKNYTIKKFCKDIKN